MASASSSRAGRELSLVLLFQIFLTLKTNFCLTKQLSLDLLLFSTLKRHTSASSWSRQLRPVQDQVFRGSLYHVSANLLGQLHFIKTVRLHSSELGPQDDPRHCVPRHLRQLSKASNNLPSIYVIFAIYVSSRFANHGKPR